MLICRPFQWLFAATTLIVAPIASTAHAIDPVHGETAIVAPAAGTQGFVSLFDGKTFEGWKVSEENPKSWQIVDGTLTCVGDKSHLFYIGKLAPFTNFHFAAEVMTEPGSNSGIYFATKYQAEGWPKHGYEVQVNQTHRDPKKSSSLYAVENIDDPGVKDGEWYTQEIIVRGPHIVLKINGKTMVDYTEEEDRPAYSDQFERRLGDGGTFALQAHDPESVAHFKNIRVKKLDD